MYQRHDMVEVMDAEIVKPELHGTAGYVVKATRGEATVWLVGIGLYVFPNEVLALFQRVPFRKPTLWNRIVWGHMLKEEWDREQDERLKEAGFQPIR